MPKGGKMAKNRKTRSARVRRTKLSPGRTTTAATPASTVPIPNSTVVNVRNDVQAATLFLGFVVLVVLLLLCILLAFFWGPRVVRYTQRVLAPVPSVVAPAQPVAATTCVDPDKLATQLNNAHLKDPNGVKPVMDFLRTYALKQVKAGEQFTTDPNGTIFVTISDIDPKRFIRNSNQGVLVALMGGASGTVLAAYDGTWTTPVDGYLVSTCFRLNPSADLQYWGK